MDPGSSNTEGRPSPMTYRTSSEKRTHVRQVPRPAAAARAPRGGDTAAAAAGSAPVPTAEPRLSSAKTTDRRARPQSTGSSRTPLTSARRLALRHQRSKPTAAPSHWSYVTLYAQHGPRVHPRLTRSPAPLRGGGGLRCAGQEAAAVVEVVVVISAATSRPGTLSSRFRPPH